LPIKARRKRRRVGAAIYTMPDSVTERINDRCWHEAEVVEWPLLRRCWGTSGHQTHPDLGCPAYKYTI
jgi:hypothetical protein